MAFRRSTEAKFSPHGVTAYQFILMLALQESRTLTQRELADRISSDPSTARAMLVLLERSPLIRPVAHPTDSRARSVELTASGKQKLKKRWKAGQEIREEMYGGMTPKETAKLDCVDS